MENNTSKNIVGKTLGAGYLTNSEYEQLKWAGPFQYPNLVRLRTPMDGSCFFHAIAKSYFKPYILGRLNNEPLNRGKFIRQLRKDLANKLSSRVDPTNPSNNLIYYDELSGGTLRDFSRSVPEYSLNNMTNELDSDLPVGNVYNEFISNQLNKDIYILSMNKQDVYMTGDNTSLLYKNRPSIVLLVLPGHYELIGVSSNDGIKTIFEPDHPLIKAIRNRISSLGGSSNSNRN